MSKFFKRLIESPLIIFLMLVDLISNILQKSYDVLTSKVKLTDMLANIDWWHTYDIAIRIVLTICLWLLYKDYIAFKRKKNAQYLLMKQKIIALNKIMHDADGVLRDLFIEGRDRQSVALHYIVKSLNELGDTSIHVKEEDPEITKYKDKVNEKLDEKQDPLYKILNEWDDDEPVS